MSSRTQVVEPPISGVVTLCLALYHDPIYEDSADPNKIVIEVPTQLNAAPGNALVACLANDPRHLQAISPGVPFKLLTCSVIKATDGRLHLQVIRDYRRIYLREIEAGASEALQRSATGQGSCELFYGKPRINAPHPIKASRATRIRAQIQAANSRERELGPAIRNLSSPWKLGRGPSRKG